MRRAAIFAAAAAALAGTTCLSPGARALTNCTNASLNGTYTGKFAGYIGRLPLSGAGILVFDGAGNVTSASVLSFSKDFHVFQNIGASGTYFVNSNCTGALSLNVNLGNGQQHFVIAVNGTGFVGVQTDFSTSVTLEGKP